MAAWSLLHHLMESTEEPDGSIIATRIIRGVIVRRRSLGAKLAFANVKCKDDTIEAVAFRAMRFHSSSENAFPIKKSMIPYGATVEMCLEHSPDKRSNSTQWQVVSWTILENPCEQAQNASRQDEGGIVYSKYLQMRGYSYLDLQESKAVDRPPRPKCLRDDCNHGRNKALRAKIFAKWLVENMDIDKNDIVLDIAGGKGLLSMELARTARSKCIVVDPLIRKRPNMKHLEKMQAPLPKFLSESFYNNAETVHSSMAKSSTLLVGLHPDECTEDILEVALKCDKSVAIVPCCVFPSLFPSRRLKNGQTVTLYADFLDYLLEKDSRLQRAELPIDGKNQVIYLKQRGKSSFTN